MKTHPHLWRQRRHVEKLLPLDFLEDALDSQLPLRVLSELTGVSSHEAARIFELEEV